VHHTTTHTEDGGAAAAASGAAATLRHRLIRAVAPLMHGLRCDPLSSCEVAAARLSCILLVVGKRGGFGFVCDGVQMLVGMR